MPFGLSKKDGKKVLIDMIKVHEFLQDADKNTFQMPRHLKGILPLTLNDVIFLYYLLYILINLNDVVYRGSHLT